MPRNTFLFVGLALVFIVIGLSFSLAKTWQPVQVAISLPNARSAVVLLSLMAISAGLALWGALAAWADVESRKRRKGGPYYKK